MELVVILSSLCHITVVCRDVKWQGRLGGRVSPSECLSASHALCKGSRSFVWEVLA